MVVLKCNLNYFLSKYNVSINKLAKDLKLNRTTLSIITQNEYLINNRIPADLIAGICEYFNEPINEMFEIVPAKKTTLKQVKKEIDNKVILVIYEPLPKAYTKCIIMNSLWRSDSWEVHIGVVPIVCSTYEEAVEYVIDDDVSEVIRIYDS